jgi:hypothetical protein
MCKVLLTNDIKEDKTAGLKARVDVLKALKEEGYETIYFPRFRSIGAIRKFWKALSATVKKGDHIVIEYPVWLKRRLYLVKTFARLNNVKFYGIIHDITSIRFQISPKRDIVALKSFDGIISHNPTLTKWLRENGYRKKIVDLEVFDYLLDNDMPYNISVPQKPYKLLYAGNLSFAKAAYIYNPKLSAFGNFELHVYGQYLEEDKFGHSDVVYKGTFNPDTPTFDCAYQFGLIWEGTSIETCDGEFGNYIRYNDPHKFSLYISLGLPVIVWKEAAIAKFVLDHNIGFTISSLKELDTILGDLPAEQYKIYADSVLKISPKVRNGYFIKTAMQKLVNS